jgi:hypothetical protein
MAFPEDHGTIIFELILSSEGLAHIGENIFDQFDGKSLAKSDLVCKLWRQFIINRQLWKRRYLHKLAKPGTKAHGLIKSNARLFQIDQQADQGTEHYHCFFHWQ